MIAAFATSSPTTSYRTVKAITNVPATTAGEREPLDLLALLAVRTPESEDERTQPSRRSRSTSRSHERPGARRSAGCPRRTGSSAVDGPPCDRRAATRATKRAADGRGGAPRHRPPAWRQQAAVGEEQQEKRGGQRGSRGPRNVPVPGRRLAQQHRPVPRVDPVVGVRAAPLPRPLRETPDPQEDPADRVARVARRR